MAIRSLPEYMADPTQFWSLFFLTSAGDFYGGFLGALLAAALFFHRDKDLPFWRAADVCAPAIALGQSIGRIGCLMAGDDYGSQTSLPWAVTFTDPDAARIGGAPLGIPLHPVQLYESVVCLSLFFFLLWLSRRRRFEGEIFLAYTIIYAAARFLLEYLRGDADRGFLLNGHFSTSQFIAILASATSMTLLINGFRQNKIQTG
jgi:phosphatidylglycerol:prolipoprotein diacylglycerol transferase